MKTEQKKFMKITDFENSYNIKAIKLIINYTFLKQIVSYFKQLKNNLINKNVANIPLLEKVILF